MELVGQNAILKTVSSQASLKKGNHRTLSTRLNLSRKQKKKPWMAVELLSRRRDRL